MLIIWGTKGFEKTLGTLASVWKCEHCQNESHYRVFRVRRWFTLFWIPIFPIGSKFFVTCPICNYGKKLKKAEAVDLLEKYNNSVLTEEQNN